MKFFQKFCEAIVDHGLMSRRDEFVGNRGFTGPQGDKGEKGEPGEPGTPGPKGIGLDSVKAVYLIKKTAETENGTETSFPKIALVYYDPEKGEDVVQACEFGLFDKESDIYKEVESFSDKAKNILI